MKVIKYDYKGHPVTMEWNETNENVAKNEADGGVYTVTEASDCDCEDLMQ